ncbi:hypothetical protein FA13DRAFT_1799047 [Coprinellus micaceus]|uniref:F-box domain-containing protein n=1 Tax=Coprinellus micaceus TaxID=71717 RepID=A0A4Y7SK84_COPMI|nr:hypothetical protein FA13DRAFT_1799047 [Coprinellus micaceus]
MDLLSLSNPETPFGVPEILDRIIDLLRHSKDDLLAVALIDAIAELAQLSRSPTCTILRPTYQSVTILALAGDSDATPLAPPSDNLFSFIQKIVVTHSIAVNLDSKVLEDASVSFPWSIIASWTTLTDLCLSGALPSIATLADGLVELPELESIEVDVDYLDVSIPTSGGRISSRLRSLSLGPRGYGLLSWLAGLETQHMYIQTLSLKIDRDQLLPLQVFSGYHGGNVEYFTATLYANRASDLAPCLRALTEVYEFEFYLKYATSSRGYSTCIRSLASSITSACAQTLTFYTPPLPEGELEASQLNLLAKNALNIPDDEEEPCSISVYGYSGAPPPGLKIRNDHRLAAGLENILPSGTRQSIANPLRADHCGAAAP